MRNSTGSPILPDFKSDLSTVARFLKRGTKTLGTRMGHKGRTIIFLEGGGGGGMKNIEKNCLQGLKRQNKLFANIICIKKIVCIEVRETFFLIF